MDRGADSPVTANRKVKLCIKPDDSSVAHSAHPEPAGTVAPNFRIEATDPEDGVVVIAVSGELDLAVADQFQEAIDRSADASRVLVDLAECEFLDSTGIAVLIRGREALAADGRTLAISNPRRQVLRVLDVTGLTRLDGFVAERPPDPAHSS